MSSRRAQNKFLPILRSLPNNFFEAYNSPQSMVYAVFSIHNHHIYVGETERTLLVRFREELSSGLNAARSGSGTWFARQISRLGVSIWSVVPICLLGAANKTYRLKAESKAILHLGATLNSSANHKRCTRLSVRRRALKAGKSAARQRPNNPSAIRPLTFTRFQLNVANKTTSFVSLDQAMLAIKGNTISTHVSVIRGSYDLTNYHVLRHDFAGNHATLAALRRGTISSAPLVIRHVRTHSRSVMQQLVFLARHPHAWRDVLKQCSIGTLLDLWVRSSDIANNRLREGAQNRMRAAMARRLKVSRIPSLIVRYPFAPNVCKRAISATARFVINNLKLSSRVKSWMISQLRVIPAKQASVSQILTTNRQFARNTLRTAPVCTCQAEPHFCQRLADMPSAAGDVGRLNSAFVPIPHSTSSAALSRHFETFVSDLQRFSSLTTTAKTETAHRLSLSIQPQPRSPVSDSNSITRGTVLTVKRQLTPNVCSRIDKNNGQLLIECPVSAWSRLDKCFFSCQNFKHTLHTAQTAVKAIQADFRQCSFDQFCALLPGELPFGYADPKQSDLTRSRGIVAYNKHPARSLFKLASKALTFLFRMLPSSVTHFTLSHLDQLPTNVHNLALALPSSATSRLLLFQTDIAEMYTNLRHDAIIDSIRWLFDCVAQVAPGRSQYRCSVAVHRSTKQVRWGRAYNEDWRTLSFADLLQIVQFDLRNVLFTVGPAVFKQDTGAPIGGFISAFYGNTVCARSEHTYCSSLGTDRRLLHAMRCQDDLLAAVVYEPADASSCNRAHSIKDDFISNRVYAQGLRVKPVSIEDNRAKFVGSNVFFGDHSAYCSSFNRNWSTLDTGRQAFPRFHHWTSHTSSRAKIGTLLGSLLRCRRFCTFDTSALVEINKLVLELRLLQYPKRSILQALSTLAKRPSKHPLDVSTGIWRSSASHFWQLTLNHVRTVLSDDAS